MVQFGAGMKTKGRKYFSWVKAMKKGILAYLVKEATWPNRMAIQSSWNFISTGLVVVLRAIQCVYIYFLLTVHSVDIILLKMVN